MWNARGRGPGYRRLQRRVVLYVVLMRKPRKPRGGYRGCLPWWWAAPYVIVSVVFAAVVVYLVAHGVEPTVAIGVPAILSGVTVGGLTAAARIARPAV